MPTCRILLVLNNCLSQHNANGRTMLRLLSGIPKDKISQIFTYSETADTMLCGASLRITNRDVAISHFKKPVCTMTDADNPVETTIHSSGLGKNAITMLLRDIVWDHSPRIHRMALKWARRQKPDMILLQVGDASLQISIALYLAHHLRIPLITYNTEDYYFKKHDYMRRTEQPGIAYRVFHRRFCRAYNRLMKAHPVCLYNCVGLKEIYDRTFGNCGEVVYCGSDFEPVKSVREDGAILYAGNLGVGRHTTLIALGKALQRIDVSLRINVYGDAPVKVSQALRSAPGISYHGVVSYEEVRNKIAQSRLLVHVESFDPFTAMDTKYAFSTKIADYMMSGIPILYCGPLSGEGAAYLAGNDMAFIVSDQSQAEETLRTALQDKIRREYIAANALRMARINHDSSSIQRKFAGIIARIPIEES